MPPIVKSCPSAGTARAKPHKPHGTLMRGLSAVLQAFKHGSNRVVVPDHTSSAEQASQDPTLATSDPPTSIPIGNKSRSDGEAATTSRRPTFGRRMSSGLRQWMRRTSADPTVDTVTTLVVEEQVALSPPELHSMAAMVAKNVELEANKKRLEGEVEELNDHMGFMKGLLLELLEESAPQVGATDTTGPAVVEANVPVDDTLVGTGAEREVLETNVPVLECNTSAMCEQLQRGRSLLKSTSLCTSAAVTLTSTHPTRPDALESTSKCEPATATPPPTTKRPTHPCALLAEIRSGGVVLNSTSRSETATVGSSVQAYTLEPKSLRGVSFESTSSQECTLGVQTDAPVQSVWALIERAAAERRCSVTGTDGGELGDSDSDGWESDDDSWIDN
jgi:hypothetical protein